MSKKPIRACPCGSGERYRTCCGPLHDGARAAATPEALMRSRWSAFALGLGDYLYDTLASGHPDRSAPRAAAVRELSRAREHQRFLALTVIEAPAPRGGDGEVLFHARIFDKGVDVSFAELSRFVVEPAPGGERAWRYASGVLVPRARLPADLSALDRQTFLALAGGT
jgi:SEC-C motif-containing protein